jgi:hypothetical protein
MKRAATLYVTSIADGIGALSATVCALHCIALPAILIVGTAVPTVFLDDESFHRAMLWLVVPSAVLAIGLGCWRHKDRWALLLGAIGLTGMVLSGVALHGLVGEFGEVVVTLVSASILIAAHVRNFKLCRSESCRHDAT